MRIHLPNSAFVGNIDPFLASISTDDSTRLDVTLNPNWVAVHPIVLSMTAALASRVKSNNGTITCNAVSPRSKGYLVRMGLFDILGLDGGKPIQKHEPAGRFIPLTNVRDSLTLKKFIEDLSPLLHQSERPNQAEAIKYVVSELLRNVIEHAESPLGGFVCAQFFKKSNRVAIGVADTGVGVKKTINFAYSAETDSDAIRLALTPGVTGTTTKPGGTETNAGAGLFFIKSIAKINKDYFLFYSGNAAYKLLKTPVKEKVRLYADPLKDKNSMKTSLPNWQGTAVGVDISVDENQDFSELLGLIRQVYRLDAEDKRRFKRAKFI